MRAKNFGLPVFTLAWWGLDTPAVEVGGILILLICVIVLVVVVLLAVFNFIRYLVRGVRDHRSLSHWLGSCGCVVGAELLVSQFEALRTNRWRLRLLQEVRKRDLLKPSADGELALRKLGERLANSKAQRDEVFRLAEHLNDARSAGTPGV